MKKQKEIFAYMNHGRWIVNCPRCGTALEASERGVICGICYPNIRAKAMKPIEGGLFRPVPDPEMIAEARGQAEAAGESYVVVYPPDRAQGEAVLRMRKSIGHMNWDIGEALEALIAENREHGDPLPKGVK